jgi:DNA-binding NarL/FixJ family response regulator
MIKIMIVDDHKLFIDGVKAFLQGDEHIEIIGQAEDGDSAIALVKEKKPDVVLLDLHLPNTHGEAVMAKMRAIYPKLKILAVTMSDNETDIQRMIHNGANGYLLKNKGKEELINAIHQVDDGHKYLSLELALKAIPKPKKPDEAKLTKRELEILALVKKGMTDKEIGSELKIASVTVEKHCQNMRKKSKTRNKIELINYATEHELF